MYATSPLVHHVSLSIPQKFTDDPMHDPWVIAPGRDIYYSYVPRYAATRGLLWSHLGWMFFRRHYERISQIDKEDLESDPGKPWILSLYRDRLKEVYSRSISAQVLRLVAIMWGVLNTEFTAGSPPYGLHVFCHSNPARKVVGRRSRSLCLGRVSG